MEATMLKTFCRRQNLTTLYSPSILPPMFREAAAAFQQYFHYDSRGTWAADTGVGGSTTTTTPTLSPVGHQKAIPDGLSKLLTKWISEYDRGAYSYQFAEFADEAVSSQLKFAIRPRGAAEKKTNPYSTVVTMDNHVGFIRNIFLHTRRQGQTDIKQVFVEVECLQELTREDAKLDYFRENALASGRLLYNHSNRTAVYSLSQISHCVLTPMKLEQISRKLRHVLPVRSDLVNFYLLIFLFKPANKSPAYRNRRACGARCPLICSLAHSTYYLNTY